CIACHNSVHFGPEEAFESLRWSIDDRFVFVEAGIQEHRNAGEFFEFLDQPVIKRILRSVYGLQAARAIDVRARRQKVPFLVAVAETMDLELSLMSFFTEIGCEV